MAYRSLRPLLLFILFFPTLSAVDIYFAFFLLFVGFSLARPLLVGASVRHGNGGKHHRGHRIAEVDLGNDDGNKSMGDLAERISLSHASRGALS
jgi:hypothetical protein